MPRVKMAKEAGAYVKKDALLLISGYMKINKVKQSQIGEAWGMTQQGAGYILRTGNMSIEQFAKACHLLEIPEDEIVKAITY